MREEYDLSRGRPSPYAERLGQDGRAQLLAYWATRTEGVRVLPPDLASEFPDSESTEAALRLVLAIRKLVAREPRSKRGRAA